MIRDLIISNRSYRRFDSTACIDISTLRQLVDLARMSASGSNMQPLKYVITCDAPTNARIFEHLAWAGYLTDWPGPAESEKPTAYITILHDTTISKEPGVDHGIAAQSILLGAAERGLGGCMIGSVNRAKLAGLLNLPENLRILLVIPIGKPAERVVLEDAKPGGSIEYYRSDDSSHHVPKRTLDEIII